MIGQRDRSPASRPATPYALPERPLVLVALFGCLAFGMDDRGLRIAVLTPQVRSAL